MDVQKKLDEILTIYEKELDKMKEETQFDLEPDYDQAEGAFIYEDVLNFKGYRFKPLGI